jgi:hypothetical protein
LRHSGPTVSLHVDGVLCAIAASPTRVRGVSGPCTAPVRSVKRAWVEPYVRVAWWLNRTGARGGVVVEWSYNCCLSRLATCVRLHDRCKQYRSANARTARALCVYNCCLSRLATCVRLHDRCKQYRSANARTARALCVPAFVLVPARRDRSD